MQIQIKSLEVKNCGPLHDVEIDFTTNGVPRPVTVIGGANGSGKTTILELIFALGSFLYNPTRKRQDEDIRRILAHAEEVRMNLLADNVDFSIFYGSTSPEKGSWEILTKNYSQSAFVLTENVVNRLREAIQKQEGQKLELFTKESTSQSPSILYFPYYRRLELLKGRQINSEKISYQWTYWYEAVRSFKGSLDSYLVWLEYAHPERFAEVRQFLNETLLVGKTIAEVNRSELTTMVKLADGETHRLDELSSGEQNLLIIMLELWRRLLPGSIVLIDEIENSLHPAFQYRLAEALLKLQKQIPFQLIVTTHAPSFLDAFGAESTLLLTEF